MKSGWRRNSLIYIAILLAAVALFSFLLPTTKKPEEIPLSEAIVMSQNGEIEKIVVEDEELLITTTSGTELKTFKESNANIYDVEGLNLQGVVIEIKGVGGINWGNLLINFLPLILLGALLFFLFRRAQGANSQALSFGRS